MDNHKYHISIAEYDDNMIGSQFRQTVHLSKQEFIKLQEVIITYLESIDKG